MPGLIHSNGTQQYLQNEFMSECSELKTFWVHPYDENKYGN